MNPKEGYSLRPRLRRRTPLLDISISVILGAISGVYIFNDTLRKVGMPPSIEEAANSAPSTATEVAPPAKE
ncbi:unnamed protein product [Aphanomyces euteiches]